MKHADLWRRYKQQGDQAAREELVQRYAPMVAHMAGWLASGLHGGARREDLEVFGLTGLLAAIDHFDPDRGISFENYAPRRVRGAMLDGVRADSWAPSLRRKQQALEEAAFRLHSRLGRMPEDGELAEELGLTPAELQRWQNAVGALTVLSLDEPWVDDNEAMSPADLLADPAADDPAAAAVASEDRRLLAEAIDALPERERLIISLVYYEGLALKEVAAILGVSLPRASQLHSRALLRLRTQMAAAPVQAP